MKFNSFSFFLIIIIIIYIYCYFIFPSNIQILQTNIDDFNFSLLYMRQPIVIPDYLKEKEKLIHSWFNYNFISNNDNDNDNWNHNHNKYLFISAVKDTEVIIYKASVYSKDPEEDDRIIAIKLEKNQSLILPFKWKYYIKRNEVELWKINDFITSFLQFFL